MSGAGSWRLVCYQTLESTSDLCIRLAGAGEPAGLAVLALRQTAGRGSRGRGWCAPEGNLNLSVLLRPDLGAAEAGGLALLAALALAEALSAMCPGLTLTLKWPNDLLLSGRKLAGILLDAASGPDGRIDWVVIGFGANLARAPEIPGRAPSCLAEAGFTLAPEALAPALLARLDHWLGINAADGFAPVRDAWLGLAHPPGTPIRLAQGGSVAEGRFCGLASDGALLMATDAGLRRFAAGEVLLAEAV